jgi:HlyD family secretion protein
VPLITLIDLNDVWVGFDLREDHVRIPALGDRSITVEVKLISTNGEYACWRATRASKSLLDLPPFHLRCHARRGAECYLSFQEAHPRCNTTNSYCSAID